MRTSFLACSWLALGLAACSTEVEPENLETSEAALSAGNSGFFVVTRPDLRTCAAPTCGGIFVKRVNQESTRCADGLLAADCYVATFDAAGMGLSVAETDTLRDLLNRRKVLVRATLGSTRRTRAGAVRLGNLRVTEAYRGASGALATGMFYRAANNGTRCIQGPCPSITAFALNRSASNALVSVNLDRVAASATDKAEAREALQDDEGVLLAGNVLLPKCVVPNTTNCGPSLNVQEFYLPMTREIVPPQPRTCGGLRGAGCGVGEYCSYPLEAICGAADAPGTCEKRPATCLENYVPVCGCDDLTYSNACAAGIAGVSIAANGTCRR
jgi:Kazal-type serine protease inhibitor domain